MAPHVCSVIHQNALGGAYVRSAWAALGRLGVLSSQLRALLVTQLPVNAVIPAFGGAGGSGAAGGLEAGSTANAGAPLTDVTAGAAGACVFSGPDQDPGAGTGASLGAGHGCVLGRAPGAGGWAAAAALSDAPAMALVQSAGEEGMCLATVTLAQLLFGFVFPTILVYVLEGYSRDYFCQAVAYGGAAGSGGWGGGSSRVGGATSSRTGSRRSSGDGGGGAGEGSQGEAEPGAQRRRGNGPAAAVDAAASPRVAREGAAGAVGASERGQPGPLQSRPLLLLPTSERGLCADLDLLQRGLGGLVLVMLVLLLWELLLFLHFLLLPQLLRAAMAGGYLEGAVSAAASAGAMPVAEVAATGTAAAAAVAAEVAAAAAGAAAGEL